MFFKEAYTAKMLKHFYIDKSRLLSPPMIVRLLDAEKDPFWPRQMEEELLDFEVPYLNMIGVFGYLDIIYVLIYHLISILERYIIFHLHKDVGVKHIMDMSLFYSCYHLLYPRNGILQTNYLFTCDTSISLRLIKQSISATSSNHT